MSEIELVVLGLINEQPRHGYQIEELIEERGVREWTNIAFSSIYYVLKRLDNAELVVSELKEANRGSAKKVYSISNKGKEALREGILDILSTPKFGRSILLGLANFHVLSRQEAIEALSNYKNGLEQKRTELQQKPLDGLPIHVTAMFDYSITKLDAELAWLSNFLNTIS